MKKVEVIKYFQNPTGVANKLRMTVGAVSQWGDVIPEKQALKLDRITNGELKYDPELYAAPDKTGQEKAEAA
jgi:hypothetical protein